MRVEVSAVTETNLHVEALDGTGASVPATLHRHAPGTWGEIVGTR